MPYTLNSLHYVLFTSPIPIAERKTEKGTLFCMDSDIFEKSKSQINLQTIKRVTRFLIHDHSDPLLSKTSEGDWLVPNKIQLGHYIIYKKEIKEIQQSHGNHSTAWHVQPGTKQQIPTIPLDKIKPDLQKLFGIQWKTQTELPAEARKCVASAN